MSKRNGDGGRDLEMERRFAKLVNAVSAVYFAAVWSPDRACPADKLWTDLRDAAGFAPGYSTEVLSRKS